MPPLPIFPLFKLPFLNLQDVLSNFSVSDIITYSLISKKCYRIAETIRHIPLSRLLIYVEKETLDICFSKTLNDLTPKTCGKWRFDLGETSKDKPFTMYENEKEVQTDWLNPDSYPFLDNDPVQSFNKSLQYLIAFFDVAIEEIIIWPDGAENCIAKLNRLEIFECPYTDIDSPNPLKNGEDLNAYLLETNITDLAIFNIKAGPDFVFNPRLCSPSSICFMERSGEWMTRELLFGLRSSTIIAFNCDSSKVTGMDFMHFVNEWFYSESESDVYAQFRQLSMTWENGYGHVDEDYWMWFRPQKWEDFNRGQYIPLMENEKIDASEGWDIKGFDLRGTILIKPNSLHFYVWHEPFPDFSHCQLIE